MLNLISRRQYNDCRKLTANLCEKIRKRVAEKMNGAEEFFCVDSKPIEVCRLTRVSRCTMGADNFATAPAVGYCATQEMYYYGYKLHAVCSLSGVIHSYDMSLDNVHDIKYMEDVKLEYNDCCILEDKAYVSAKLQ